MTPTRRLPAAATTPPWSPPADISRRNLALTRAGRDLNGVHGRVLEGGAGTARFLRALRQLNPAVDPIACDLALSGLRYARHQDPAIQAAQADFTALPFRSGAFQAVLVFDVLEHLHQPQEAIAEIWRVLEPGGLVHALVPCEGQPLTLHWLMWKTGLGADIKKRSVGHVQRFTHGNFVKMLTAQGFRVTRVSYSMHPLGQIKDVLLHLEDDHRLPRWLSRNPVYRAFTLGLWGGAYVESSLLARIPFSAVALHLTAMKP